MCMLRRKAVAQILEFVLNARHHSRSGLRPMSAVAAHIDHTPKADGVLMLPAWKNCALNITTYAISGHYSVFALRSLRVHNAAIATGFILSSFAQ